MVMHLNLYMLTTSLRAGDELSGSRAASSEMHQVVLILFNGGATGGAIELLFASLREGNFIETFRFPRSHSFLFHTGSDSLSTSTEISRTSCVSKLLRTALVQAMPFFISASSSMSPLPNWIVSTFFPLAVFTKSPSES